MVWCIWAASSVMMPPTTAVFSLGCQSRRYGKPQKTGVCAPCAPSLLIHPINTRTRARIFPLESGSRVDKERRCTRCTNGGFLRFRPWTLAWGTLSQAAFWPVGPSG